MKKTVLLFVLGALLVGGVPVLADGAFYWPESIPPEIPYQRALLLFDGGYETLIVQSKYRMSSSATDEFGWVVPVPSVPDLASIEPDLAESLFSELTGESRPTITDVSELLCGLLVFICLLLLLPSGIMLLLSGVSFSSPRLEFIRRRRGLVAVVAVLLFVFSLAVVAFYIIYYSRASAPSLTGAVEVIREERVGIYNVQVVKAGEAEGMIQWLKEHRFQFDEEDTRVFDEYLSRGWCFVVAQVDPMRSVDQMIVAEGLVAPLMLRFETDAPVYPLALTATAGHDTQVLLYLLSKGKWQTDGRLNLEYAGKAYHTLLEEVCREASPDLAAACLEDATLSYLCKFKGTLTPAQMEEDLVLTPAEDNDPYRKQVIEW